MMERILITGGTGLIGKQLTKALIKEGYHVVVLSRSPKNDEANLSFALWNIEKEEIDPRALEGIDHIIHFDRFFPHIFGFFNGFFELIHMRNEDAMHLFFRTWSESKIKIYFGLNFFGIFNTHQN